MADVTARKVRELREAKGMSKSALARATGMSLAYIIGLEAGRFASPGGDSVMKLAKALEVEPGFLIDDEAVSVASLFETSGVDMPEEVRAWLGSQHSLAWVKLTQRLDEEGISPEALEGLIDLLRAMASRGSSVER